MRIKRIEIIGFKSFCDRTVLNITSPVTSVVGPNGCGKSNIVDAIRWCMGEQSARHLRGKAMDDVIFAGSESRGPASMAEVSLTFEDVGFSHETLQLALNQAEAEGDPSAVGAGGLDRPAADAGEAGADAEAGEQAASADATEPAMDAEAGETGTDAEAGEAGEQAAGADTEAGAADGVTETADASAAADASGDPGAAVDERGEAEAADAGGEVAASAGPGEGEPAADAGTSEAAAAGLDGEDGGRSASEEVEEFLEDKPPAFDFAQYSEVTVTRRLFRDGTSQYLINRIPCRLRDVTDFFLGTGVGTKAYSIIEQGRVGMIVSARPQDRRTIIEEAAGITKFKTKKRAAERKLEQTRHNLLRVSDIVSELGKRMGSLRRQAQKAERYRRYKSELRDIELWKATHRYLELVAEEKVLRAGLTAGREELAQVRAEYEAKDALAIAERAELGLEERRLASLQETIYELENRIKLSENKVGFQGREATEIDARVSAAGGEITGLASRREEGRAQLEVQQAELERLVELSENEQDEVAARELAVSEARQMLANAQSRLDEARQALAQARADEVRAESQRQSLARRREETARRLERVMSDTGADNERVAQLDKEHRGLAKSLSELQQTRLDLGSQAENLEARRADLDHRVHEGEARVETLRTELHRRRSRLQSLIEIQEKYEGFARGTRAVMQASAEHRDLGGEIRGLVADVVRAPATLEAAVEAALGDRLGGVLVASADVGVQAVHFLKHESAGRSAFVPFDGDDAAARHVSPARSDDTARGPIGFSTDLRVSGDGPWAQLDFSSDIPGLTLEIEADEVEPGASAFAAGAGASSGGAIEVEDRTYGDHEGVLGRMVDLVSFDNGYACMGRRLFGECLVVDGLERAVALHRDGLARTLVTLDGDIVDERGVVFGGSRDAQGAGVLAQKREIRELEEITDSLDRELTDATAEYVASKSEHQQVVRALEALRKESHQGDIAILAHEKDVARARAELDRLRERLTQLNAEQLELEERMRGVSDEDAELEELARSAGERIGRFEREQLGYIEGVTDGRARVEELAQLLTEARVHAAQMGEKRASMEASVLRLEASERELGERIAKLEADIEQGTARAAELRASSAEIEAELEGLRADRRTNAETMEAGRSAYEQRLAELQMAEVAVRSLRSRAETLSGETTQLELKLGNLEANLHALVESTADRYQVDVAVDLFDYHLRPPATPAEDKRLVELKRLIERMGTDINLTAIDEYAEVSQRHDFLKSQRDDLERAVDQLDAAIQKINRTSRKLFRDTYAAVNAKFQEVFPRLFRGGQARLKLTPPKGAEGQEVDILEAGVEIIAQPPGKKNSTVDQLSGGEKALTAVALIFSIFLIKPSPFCILDEVDAPLDDANVDRYNEIVREMTDRSQFIVITHNKRTMEIADNLYGVTMQEPGVSKLVSVNLSKIDERVAA
ncbi:AAA family ATPase [Haliangium sp.]|uniref:AAA family ATPase n=1 Tax=Haliangium sp. TaxID=2663208 RepID=UPI003D14662A